MLLRKFEEEENRFRRSILANQKSRVQALVDEGAAGSAKRLLSQIDQLDPVTIDDAIAELTAGREVPDFLDKPPDPFEGFYPEFVEAVDASEGIARGMVLNAISGAEQLGPLDFTRHSKAQIQIAKQMVEVWARVEHAMKNSQWRRLGTLLARLFGLIGFANSKVTDPRDLIHGRMRSGILQADVSTASHWFLPSAFGSGARGRYRLLVARSGVSIDQMLRQTASEGPDDAWIAVYLGKLSKYERQRLARDTRRQTRQMLVLDETLLLYLSSQSMDPLELFFICTLPFCWTQPYSTSAGRIPPEAFFGRREEMRRVLQQSNGGCLIYGGRQLGKSALLYHIRGERHRPQQGEVAIYMDIKPIGGAGNKSERIWMELHHELRQAGVLKETEVSDQEIVTGLETWLDVEPGRRVIVMFDEADNFLRAEHGINYLNLQRLKNLMERTGWRFKAVFAGLHNVLRLAQAPNSPLPQLGEAVCIGPMNQTAENRAELRRLAIEPMRAAGLSYTEPHLAYDMLARMNYYPSLVQVFGWQVVENHGHRIPAAQDGPRWSLSREKLFEGEAAERIGDQIRQRFQWTLNLDIRYELIAKSIALHRLDAHDGASDVLSDGMSTASIGDLVMWPSNVTRPSHADLQQLLNEMVDLGVLGRLSDGQFGLRNAQIAQLLGTRERLEDEILNLNEIEGDPAYDAAIYHCLLRPELPDSRSPLPDRAIEELVTADTPGLRLVIGNPKIIGPKLDSRLTAAVRRFLDDDARVQTCTSNDHKRLRTILDKKEQRLTLIVIEGVWNAVTAKRLTENPRVETGGVLPIWCVDSLPDDFGDAKVFRAGVWEDAMLRHWLVEEGLAPMLDEAKTRSAIMAATGGAPCRIEAMKKLLYELATLNREIRSERIANWVEENPISYLDLGLDGHDDKLLTAIKDTIRDRGDDEVSSDELEGIGGPDVSTALPRLIDSGCIFVSPFADGKVRLSHLGALLRE